MPKVIDTRKQRAAELQRMLTDGPHMAMPYEKLSQEEIKQHYDLWFNTWIKRELMELIPELRKKAGA